MCKKKYKHKKEKKHEEVFSCYFRYIFSFLDLNYNKQVQCRNGPLALRLTSQTSQK